MSAKFVISGVVCALTVAGAALGYFLPSSSGTYVNPNGKTLKTKYPNLRVPKQIESLDYNNSFWRGKTDKFKSDFLNNKELLKSIKEVGAKGGGYLIEDNYFNLTDRKSFLVGDSEIATRLAKYCAFNWDKEEKEIKDYPEIMKDLCAE